MRVGVIFGGRSVEHEVSIVTAHQLMAVLSDGHAVVPIYISREGRWFTGPGLQDLDVYRTKRWEEVGQEAVLAPTYGSGGLTIQQGRLKPPKKVPLDVVVPAVHGTFGEDGTLQGLLELAGIPYAGSGVAASAVGMDKVAMKAALRGAGLPLVPDVVVDLERSNGMDAGLDEVERTLGYPAFVKPVKAGSSVGIGKARDRAELQELIDVAGRYDSRVLVEEAMEGCVEINCSVLGGGGRDPRVSVCEQPVAWKDFLSFEDKYMRGGKSATGKADLSGSTFSSAERGPSTDDASSDDAAPSSDDAAPSSDDAAPWGTEDEGEPSEPRPSEGMASLDRRIPAPISEEATKQIQENALAAFSATGASGVARVDSFLNPETGQTWVMEINTTPGSFAFYLWEASGLGFRELVDELLGIAMERHRATSERLFTFDSGMLEAARGGKTP